MVGQLGLRLKKKKKSGASSQYITRAKALMKLQLTLPDFRRLCILKGIYPREPKKKFAGAEKTYYHKKDIQYMAHEPILRKFFEIKTSLKRQKKHMQRHSWYMARREENKRPDYTLHHIVKERYPSFDDALRDLDDGICMVAMMQSLPANKNQDIRAKVITEAAKLYDEWSVYCIHNHSLRKCFASIKGYYFQAEVLGQVITWLTPHQFSQSTPEEVDFKPMLTFLEFYSCLLKFVNFKLYTSCGWNYPPEKDAAIASDGMRAAAIKATRNAEVKVSTDFDKTEEGSKLQQATKAAKDSGNVFAGLKFFINREVPFGPLHFIARCGGAEVGWEGESSPFKQDGDVTHFIVDKPPEFLKTREGCEYVQPQWILDCFNCKVLIPIGDYAPGKVPPPHLSPFIDDATEGYVPEQREVLNQLISQKKEEEIDEEEMSDEEIENKFQEELEAEQKGVWYSEFQDNKATAAAEAAKKLEDEPILEVPAIKKKTKREREEEENKERAKAMMTGKHRRLLQKIEYSQAQKDEAVETLTKKRAQKKFKDKVAAKKAKEAAKAEAAENK